MSRKHILLVVAVASVALVGATLPGTSPVASDESRTASPPVATNDATYAAYGRVFPDPQGCLAVGFPDQDGDGVKDTPDGVSPWAKGNVCATQFLQFEELVEGSRYLERRFPRFMQVIRLDEAFDNPDFRSAGLPRTVTMEDGKPKPLGRDRRPLYLLKVTDAESEIPEPDRQHFVYALSIHGIERAGVEGGVRAMEDLVTWAANEPDKPIIETPTDEPVPTAGGTLQNSVVYFMLANPDGWGRGQVAPTEFEDGAPNLNYTPGVFFQRYNGNGVDMNRDWPTAGYTYRPYSPASEPEVKAFAHALREIARSTSTGRFAGGIDLHGQLTADAFSYTLLGAGQRDYRKNLSTVDQSLRTWTDQTQRLDWSPYIPTVFPVADQWGTVIDTIGYQVSGSLGDWFESDIVGLGAVGIDNEMSLSHLAPNNLFDPTTEQMHIDGNKGLIYSQVASMLTEEEYVYDPPGKIGYVFNPKRISHDGDERVPNPGLPAQNDIDVLVPCQSDGPQDNDLLLPCEEPGASYVPEGTIPTLEFDVHGPDRGIWNGGITVQVTHAHAAGMSAATIASVELQRYEEEDGRWETVASDFNQSIIYLQAGQIVTANDPIPGRWRVRLSSGVGAPARIQVDFHRHSAEEDPGQAPFSASSMDFFTDLNRYIVDPAEQVEAVTVTEVIDDPATLQRFDTLIVVNDPLPAYVDEDGVPLGLSPEQRSVYYTNLRGFAEGGGNLVLTDGAIQALAPMQIVPTDAIRTSKVLAGRYEFDVPGRGFICNEDPLTQDVCLPGTAGGTSRQAVEPTPLGYSPDQGFDPADEASMPRWGVDRDAWEDGCGKSPQEQCTSALVHGVGLGERHVGDGVVRIVGAMFPDPNYAPGGPRDMRFGLASYAPTFSAWQVFFNVVDHQRPS